MSQHLTVFLCSTFDDLVEERQCVLDAVKNLQLTYDSMEFFGARADLPIDTCIEEVRKSDIVVVIVGHRYVNMVPGRNISFSESEYSEAQSLKKLCLIYMKDDNVPILPAHFEQDPKKLELLKKWKKDLNDRHTVAKFKSSQNLAVLVTKDLGQIVHSLTENKPPISISHENTNPIHAVPGNSNPEHVDYNTSVKPDFSSKNSIKKIKSTLPMQQLVLLGLIGVLLIFAMIIYGRKNNQSAQNPNARKTNGSTQNVNTSANKNDSAIVDTGKFKGEKIIIPGPQTNPVTKTEKPSGSESPAGKIVAPAHHAFVRSAAAEDSAIQKEMLYKSQKMLQEGKKALRVKNYDLALREFKDALLYGNTEASFFIGVLFDREGFAKNYDTAENKYTTAAKNGDTLAMVYLGNILVRKGYYKEADSWFQKAVDCKCVLAEFYRGNLKKLEDSYRQIVIPLQTPFKLPEPQQRETKFTEPEPKCHPFNGAYGMSEAIYKENKEKNEENCARQKREWVDKRNAMRDNDRAVWEAEHKLWEEKKRKWEQERDSVNTAIELAQNNANKTYLAAVSSDTIYRLRLQNIGSK
jgi:hypothetical protein